MEFCQNSASAQNLTEIWKEHSMEYGLQIEPAYGFTYEEALEAVETAQQHGYTSAWCSERKEWSSVSSASVYIRL